MIKWLCTAILILFSWEFAGTCLALPPVIISGHPEYPPIMWKQDQTIIGAAAKLTQYIFHELNIPCEIHQAGPWKRVQKYAEKGLIDVIMAAYINPERLKYMDYSIPFMSDPVVVFVKQGHRFPFNKWGDLIGKTGNTNIGESYGKDFDLFMQQYLNVERVARTVQNFMKLDALRVDYAIIGLYPGLAGAYQYGYKDRITYLEKPIIEENFYITFSKKSRYKYLLPKVNEIIRDLKSRGKIKEWINDYLRIYYQDDPGNHDN